MNRYLLRVGYSARDYQGTLVEKRSLIFPAQPSYNVVQFANAMHPKGRGCCLVGSRQLAPDMLRTSDQAFRRPTTIFEV